MWPLYWPTMQCVVVMFIWPLYWPTVQSVVVMFIWPLYWPTVQCVVVIFIWPLYWSTVQSVVVIFIWPLYWSTVQSVVVMFISQWLVVCNSAKLWQCYLWRHFSGQETENYNMEVMHWAPLPPASTGSQTVFVIILSWCRQYQLAGS